jgi:hypothetical protein
VSRTEQFGFNFDDVVPQREVLKPDGWCNKCGFQPCNCFRAEQDQAEAGESLEAQEPEVPSHAELEENGQIPLINIGEWWEEHWKQMPEFVQKDLEPWKSIYVHFENRKDMDAFAKLVGQQINLTTKFIWYPEATVSRYVRNNRRYEDAN